MAALPVLETGCKWTQLVRKLGVRLPIAEIFGAVIKSHFKLAYYLAFYIVRYHLLPLVVLACILPDSIGLWLAIIVFPALVTYLQKRPQLGFPVFVFFYLAEHAFYQSGAFWGCIKQKSFRLYRIIFRHAGFLGRSRPSTARRSMCGKQTSKEVVGG